MFGAMLGYLGGALTKAATNYLTEKKKTNTGNTVINNQATNTQNTNKTPTYNYNTTPEKKTNEHADYINQTYAGGLDAYKNTQQNRYNQALTDDNVDLINRLNADSQKVGYKLTNQNIVPQFDNQPYIDQVNAVYGKLGNYESQLANIQYPNFDKHTKKMDSWQDDMSSLLWVLENYQGADSMSMDESMARAYSQLNNFYNANLDKTLNDYNRNAVSRGMFGQLPTEALKAQAISSSELDKASAINQLAGNMYSQDFNMARQKDADFYNKIGQQAGMLGDLYNTEVDQYQNAMNEYLNTVNLANMKDQSYYDDVYRQLDLLGTQYNMKNNEMDRYAQNIGQFSNDYMAEINRVKGDNDPSNDWQIGYLQNARNQKVAGIEQSQAQAQADSQEKLYNQAMDMFGKLGYASGWVAETLGLPEGTNTYQYANILADNARQDARGSGGSGGGSEILNEALEAYPEITFSQKISLWNEAIERAKSRKGVTTDAQGNIIESQQSQPSQQEIYIEYLNLAKIFRDNPFELQADNELAKELKREMILRYLENNTKYYSNPLLDVLRNNLSK